jgi:hypothetical protein
MRSLAYCCVPTLALALALTPTTPAHACGGMVFPDHGTRVGGMSEQELLVAFTPDSTVLVASAGYKGATGSPAFILPLPAEPTLVTQTDAGVLVALDELTAPEVVITIPSDDSGGGFCGAAGALKDGGVGNGRGDGDVMVLQRGSTADYEYVVVGGDTGESITDWLTMAGYVLPADYADALTPYIAGGNFIFAAKVKSTVADGALAPIELHLPAQDPAAFSIPYGLAAHSLPPGETLSLTTYLLASGTVVPGNYPFAAIDQADLIATSETETNYQELYDNAIGGPDGAWVVDASLEPFATADLNSSLNTAIENGRGTGADPTAVTAFTERVTLSGARLTRIRTTLGANQLRDLTLTKATLDPHSPTMYVTYDGDAGTTACNMGSRRGVPLGALLLPLLLLLRRRR